MKAIATERALFHACAIIFGPGIHISREFLEYLQLSGIKSAYRRRAMETHPDRAVMADEQSKRERHDLFHSVQQAYENLLAFHDAREKGLRLFPAPGHGRRPDRAPWQRDSAAPGRPSSWNSTDLYQGPLPNRPLLLGHFLYYSGRISWRTIIQALVWQRTQRPRLGELGIRFGLLAEHDILHILRNRLPRRSFGQTALDLLLLSEPQLQFLLLRQKQLQKKFGGYFLEKNIFTPAELRELLRQCQRHNITTARRKNGTHLRF